MKNNLEEFNEYINYCRNLDFEEEPDYRYLRGLLRNVMKSNNYEYDYEWDWVIKQNKEAEEKNIKDKNNENNVSNNLNEPIKKISQNNVNTNSNNNLVMTNNINFNNNSQNNLINLNFTPNNKQNLSNIINRGKTRTSVNNSNANLMNSSNNMNSNFNANNSVGNNFKNTNVLNKVNSMGNINKNSLVRKNNSGYKHTINTNMNFNYFNLNNPLNTKTSASATKINRANFPFEINSCTNQKNGFNYGYNLNQLKGSNGFGNKDFGPKSNKNVSVSQFKNAKI